PVAKAVGMAGQLEAFPVTFVGKEIALRYAQLNDEHFAAVEELDLADMAAARRLVRRFKATFSVMEPHLVFASVREGRPVYFFDSLFGFWLTDRSLGELTTVAETIRTGSDTEAETAFRTLSVHESMIVSH